MIETGKMYPAYAPTDLDARCFATFEYKQLVAIANIATLANKLSRSFLAKILGVSISSEDVAIITQVHNASVNCALSMESKQKVGD
jgi:hypothetical protein